jgi:hypothetical protein
MKVKCVAQQLKEEQYYMLGKNPIAKGHYSITSGKEYTVFGLSFLFGSDGNGCFIQILSDYEHLITVPIALFEIVDKRLSVLWELKIFNDGDVTLWPPSFYRDYYHDDLSEDIPDVVLDFKDLKVIILNEFHRDNEKF